MAAIPAAALTMWTVEMWKRRQQQEASMSLAEREIWQQPCVRAIVTDAIQGCGLGVLNAARELNILRGGYTVVQNGVPVDSWMTQHNLKRASSWEQAVRLNVHKSDAIIILADDPRVDAIDFIINEAKSARTKVRVSRNRSVLEIRPWLTSADLALYITGRVTFQEGADFVKRLAEVWPITQ